MTEAVENTDIENLDVVFKGEEVEETKPEEVKPEAEEPKQETKEEESEKEEPKGEDSEPPSEKEEKTVPIAALHDQRRKAQQYKEELESYKAKYDVDEEAPDPAEDPEAYETYVKAKVEKELYEKNINASREKMMEDHEDYVEVEKDFMFLANRDQNLIKEMNDSPDPARYAYEKAKAYTEAKEEEIRAKILAEAQGDKVVEEEELSESEKRNKLATQVPDLTKAAAKGVNSEPLETDEALGDMFGDSKF